MNRAQEALPEMLLTEDDRKEIKRIAENIHLNDSALCLTYGTAEQKRLAAVSDKLLRLAAEDDSAAIGDRMNDLIGELREFSSMQHRRGLFAWLFRSRDRKKLCRQYQAAAEKTDAIAEELEKHRNRLLRDFVMLGKLYDGVLTEYRVLTVLIEAGQQKLAEDSSAEKELRERFEKRLHDLKLSRMVCMQTLAQIRVLQGCNTALSEKMQSLLTNTVALWKNQTALALAMKNTGQTMEALREANGKMIGVLEEVCSAKEDVLRESSAMESLVQPGDEGDGNTVNEGVMP